MRLNVGIVSVIVFMFKFVMFTTIMRILSNAYGCNINIRKY